MNTETLMGDEAIALGAVHAGLSAAFAYPGTPSTEIMETLQAMAEKGATTADGAKFVAQWCANEKTAYESALGASYAGRRAMVSMKHVGLNVAADPFVNSALIRIHGGLVVVVADDPGMHSSQDEQDSRALAAFARMPCFEPADQQEAYDMTLEAFEFSEKHEVPVLVRITTRLAHSRAVVKVAAKGRAQNPVDKAPQDMSWILMPAVARKRWKALLGKQADFRAYAEERSTLAAASKKLGVVTAGLALQYYRENLEDFVAAEGEAPSHLHIGHYPIPAGKLRELCANVEKVLVIEDGYPVVEEALRGVFPTPIPVLGKLGGELPLDGELNPDLVRAALGLPEREGVPAPGLPPPGRPPQLCVGCPHADSFAALKEALLEYPTHAVNSDIGCYTLGALAPYNAIESCVDMGASIGMARGAAEAGLRPTVAIIGDSTFYHSGMSNLVDAVSHGTNTTVYILDNQTTGMTGAQPTIAPSSRLKDLVIGLGVDPAHVRVLDAHKRSHEASVKAIKEELAHPGPSVVIGVRVCIEAYKKERAK
ncbi:MAG: indolepyruvate ferredoxin oxidoreductase [Spirochaetia bacterium]|nr:indolepyruvate ferredoxin oxidoreductase [Spirochaetia bacterium]